MPEHRGRIATLLSPVTMKGSAYPKRRRLTSRPQRVSNRGDGRLSAPQVVLIGRKRWL
jgi:hypothetical protein